jgi:hypothetical protein
MVDSTASRSRLTSREDGQMSKKPTPLAVAISLEEPGNVETAWRAVRALWDKNHDRDVALQLAFYEWWSCREPSFLTGLPELAPGESKFPDAYAYLSSQHADDLLMKFVMGWMMFDAPYCCGPAGDEWPAVGTRLWQSFWEEGGLPPSSFDRSTEFGRYFSHVLASHSGPA